MDFASRITLANRFVIAFCSCLAVSGFAAAGQAASTTASGSMPPLLSDGIGIAATTESCSECVDAGNIPLVSPAYSPMPAPLSSSAGGAGSSVYSTARPPIGQFDTPALCSSATPQLQYGVDCGQFQGVAPYTSGRPPIGRFDTPALFPSPGRGVTYPQAQSGLDCGPALGGYPTSGVITGPGACPPARAIGDFSATPPRFLGNAGAGSAGVGISGGAMTTFPSSGGVAYSVTGATPIPGGPPLLSELPLPPTKANADCESCANPPPRSDSAQTASGNGSVPPEAVSQTPSASAAPANRSGDDKIAMSAKPPAPSQPGQTPADSAAPIEKYGRMLPPVPDTDNSLPEALEQREQKDAQSRYGRHPDSRQSAGGGNGAPQPEAFEPPGVPPLDVDPSDPWMEEMREPPPTPEAVERYRLKLQARLLEKYNNMPDFAGKVAKVTVALSRPLDYSLDGRFIKAEFDQLVYDPWGRRLPALEKEYYVITFGSGGSQTVRSDPSIRVGLDMEKTYSERAPLASDPFRNVEPMEVFKPTPVVRMPNWWRPEIREFD